MTLAIGSRLILVYIRMIEDILSPDIMAEWTNGVLLFIRLGVQFPVCSLFLYLNIWQE